MGDAARASKKYKNTSLATHFDNLDAGLARVLQWLRTSMFDVTLMTGKDKKWKEGEVDVHEKYEGFYSGINVRRPVCSVTCSLLAASLSAGTDLSTSLTLLWHLCPYRPLQSM